VGVGTGGILTRTTINLENKNLNTGLGQKGMKLSPEIADSCKFKTLGLPNLHAYKTHVLCERNKEPAAGDYGLLRGPHK